jgi:hypothetical protein
MHYKLTLGVDFALKVSIYFTSAPPFLSLSFHFPRVCVCETHTHTLSFCLRTKLMNSHQRACTCMRAYVGRDGERERKAYTKRPFICVCVCVRVCVCVVCVCVQQVLHRPNCVVRLQLRDIAGQVLTKPLY